MIKSLKFGSLILFGCIQIMPSWAQETKRKLVHTLRDCDPKGKQLDEDNRPLSDQQKMLENTRGAYSFSEPQIVAEKPNFVKFKTTYVKNSTGGEHHFGVEFPDGLAAQKFIKFISDAEDDGYQFIFDADEKTDVSKENREALSKFIPAPLTIVGIKQISYLNRDYKRTSVLDALANIALENQSPSGTVANPVDPKLKNHTSPRR